MIGKYARGFQHLYKCVENSNTTQILYYGVTNYFTAMAFCGTRNEEEKVLLCFNNVCGEYKLPKNITFSDTTKETIKQIFGSKYCYCLIIDQRSSTLGEYIILPDDFDIKWSTTNIKYNKNGSIEKLDKFRIKRFWNHLLVVVGVMPFTISICFQ